MGIRFSRLLGKWILLINNFVKYTLTYQRYRKTQKRQIPLTTDKIQDVKNMEKKEKRREGKGEKKERKRERREGKRKDERKDKNKVSIKTNE